MRRRGARPVRRAARGNGPVETPTPRPAPTQPPQGSPGAGPRLCLLVMIGVRADGRKELVALDRRLPRVRRSRGLICCVTCRRRGMTRPGARGRGRGAGVLGRACARCSRRPASSGAGSTQLQCSCRAAEVGAPGGEEGAREIWNAEDKSTTPATRSRRSRSTYGAKLPKAVAKITDDVDVAAGVLRLPGRALDTPAHDKSDRIHLRHRPAAAARSPRAPAHGPPESRWPTSSSSPPKHAGAPSTRPISSRSSAPARSSRTANSSNDPTTPPQPRRPHKRS